MAHSSLISSVPFLSSALVAFVALAAVSASADAAIPNLEWQDVETIDASVSEVSTATGAGPTHWNESWYLVYIKNNDVYLAERNGTSWELPVQVSNSSGDVQMPLIDATADELFIVWEDDRTGHAEIWLRTFDGSVWSSESCLTEDAVSSRSPSLSIYAGDANRGILVWEEGTSPSRVDGAWLTDGVFGSSITLASGSADMKHPAVAADSGDLFAAHVAWRDDRDGSDEVYARWFDDERVPQPELRMTDMPGPVGAFSISTSYCCFDYIEAHALIAFEHTAPGGVSEVWTTYYVGDEVDLPVLRSNDDGIASTGPSVASSPYSNAPLPGNGCGASGPALSRKLLSWSDEDGTLQKHHLLYFDLQEDFGEEVVTLAGLDASLAGGGGGSMPRLELALVWIEERAGGPALVARVGDVLSCNRRGFAELSWFTIGPAGVPSNRIRYEDVCTGLPTGEGMLYELSLDATLDAAIRWDPAAERPPLVGEVDAEGVLEFVLYGGGCSEDGLALLKCNGLTNLAWPGVKSPDINGDCVVTQSDLAYVESRLGTDDFCGDIDWSGLVDELDIAIVEMTLGDACSDVTVSTPETAGRPQGLSLQVHPSPARGPIQLSICSMGEPTELRVVDTAGRLVADLGRHKGSLGRTTVTWDGKGLSGGDVPSGIYFAEIRSGAGVARETILIVR